MDAAGDLFIADTCNHVVREVASRGRDLHGGRQWRAGGYSGDGGAATAAELAYPAGIALDPAGDLFIADTGNNVIREVDAGALRARSAGLRETGATATAAMAVRRPAPSLYDPNGVAVNAAGQLFIADSCNNVVRKVAAPLYWDPGQTGSGAAGGSGVWTSAAGNANSWYNPFIGADVAWCDGSSVVLGGTAGVVTLTGTVSPASIAFDASLCRHRRHAVRQPDVAVQRRLRSTWRRNWRPSTARSSATTR